MTEYRLSFAIMTHDELPEFERLMSSIYPSLRDDEEIVVVDDYSSSTFFEMSKKYNIKFFQRALEKNFSAQRNFCKQKCSGKFIFFIDADELPPSTLLDRLPRILDQMERERLDGCIVPRFNRLLNVNEQFDGDDIRISSEDIRKSPTEDQIRIIRNKDDIFYIRPLHEKIIGINRLLRLPNTPEFALLHFKTRLKAESQSEFYKSMGSTWSNILIDIKFRIIRILKRFKILSTIRRVREWQIVEVNLRL